MFHYPENMEPNQREQLPGTVPNSAGGYGFEASIWTRLDRFLILGTEADTYYSTARELTRENANSTLRCIAEDGPRVVARVVEISESGRAPKNDPALFVLAMCSKHPDSKTRAAAFLALPRVARMSTAGKPPSTPDCMASWIPASTAGMYSLGITPPVILSMNS